MLLTARTLAARRPFQELNAGTSLQTYSVDLSVVLLPKKRWTMRTIDTVLMLKLLACTLTVTVFEDTEKRNEVVEVAFLADCET